MSIKSFPGNVPAGPFNPRFPRVVTVHVRSASPAAAASPAASPAAATKAAANVQARSPVAATRQGSYVHSASPPAALGRSTLPAYPTLLKSSARSPVKSPHMACKEDLKEPAPSSLVGARLDAFLAARPEFRAAVRAVAPAPPRGGASYEINGREVVLEWQPCADRGGEGRFFVVDGPLRQPLADYIEGAEANAEYEAIVADTTENAVHLIPTDRRISFHDDDKEYSRLDAMRVAKEQALVRERAASYQQAGQALPADIMAVYSKTMQQKLKPVSATKLRERGRVLLRSFPH